MKRIFLPILGLLLAVATLPSAEAAADLPVSAFFGKFNGGGVAQNRDSIYFAVTARDFDVTISGTSGGGFRVDWTSVIRRGGTPERPKIRRKVSSKTLMPTSQPGVFRGTMSGDPLSGKELCWAHIQGNTLTVFLMTIDPKGDYELQQYDRTLVDTGMKLRFSSTRNGENVRTVTGRLVRTGK